MGMLFVFQKNNNCYYYKWVKNNIYFSYFMKKSLPPIGQGLINILKTEEHIKHTKSIQKQQIDKHAFAIVSNNSLQCKYFSF